MLHIEGRRWFQRSAGNTYHSVRIFKDGELIATLPYQYGYGDCFLQTALDWLRANKHIPDNCAHCDRTRGEHMVKDCKHGYTPHYGTLYLRETLHASYSVIDVDRQKDL